MTLFRKIQPAWIVIFLIACSKSEDPQAGPKSSTSVKTATGTATNTAPKTAPQSERNDQANTSRAILDNPGLPQNCELSPTDDDQVCISCTPRELPIRQCSASALASFDVTTRCSHDLNEIVCDLDLPELFTFDLENSSPTENLFDRIPMLVFAAKLLLGSKLDGQSDAKKALFDALDSLEQNSRALFTCGDASPAINDFAAAAKMYQPSLSTADIDAFKAKAQAGLREFTSLCKSGQITDRTVMDMLQVWFQALPGEIGQLIGPSDLAAILASFQKESEDEP